MLTASESTPIRRIVLTGFMGSGKSTVGPLLAARLGWQFLDSDNVIEAEAGCTLAELFSRHGEPTFRDLEHSTIARLASADRLVLALGGGAIERDATRSLLLTTPGTLLVHLEVVGGKEVRSRPLTVGELDPALVARRDHPGYVELRRVVLEKALVEGPDLLASGDDAPCGVVEDRVLREQVGELPLAIGGRHLHVAFGGLFCG